MIPSSQLDTECSTSSYPCPFLPSPSPQHTHTTAHLLPPAPSLFLPALSRGCVREREREKRKAVSRMDMCPLSSALSSPPICLSSLSSVNRAPRTHSESRQLTIQLQCQQGISTMVVANQKVHTWTHTVSMLTPLQSSQHPLLMKCLTVSRQNKAVHGGCICLNICHAGQDSQQCPVTGASNHLRLSGNCLCVSKCACFCIAHFPHQPLCRRTNIFKTGRYSNQLPNKLLHNVRVFFWRNSVLQREKSVPTEWSQAHRVWADAADMVNKFVHVHTMLN